MQGRYGPSAMGRRRAEMPTGEKTQGGGGRGKRRTESNRTGKTKTASKILNNDKRHDFTAYLGNAL